MPATRRSVLLGILAAPIVVRSGLIMPVKPLREWSDNELFAGWLAVCHNSYFSPMPVLSEVFDAAALRERAKPQYIEAARLYIPARA